MFCFSMILHVITVNLNTYIYLINKMIEKAIAKVAGAN